MSEQLTIGLLFSDEGYDPQRIAESLAPHRIVNLGHWPSLDEEALTAAIRDCDVVVTARRSPRLPESLIADRGRLKLLAHCHGTVKHLLSKEHIASGIRAVNWGDNVSGVAESALTLLLCCLKQVLALDAFIRADWQNDQRIYMDYPATLQGRDVGLYGFGPIGRHMARMLEPFGPHIHIYDPYATEVADHITVVDSLDELFDRCQCVSIHCGLNESTRGSVGREQLERLPQGGILINTARGAIVKEAELAALVGERRILAAVDVIENEKAWPASPLAAQPSGSALLTGHIIGGSKGANPNKPKPLVNLPQHSLENIAALAAGSALKHEITADIYDLKT